MMALPQGRTVSAIEATPYRLPMRGALRWGAHSSMAEARHVLLRVWLDDGSEGLAEALPRPTIYGETPATMAAILHDEVAPRMVGMPLEAAFRRMHEVKYNYAVKGALDIALHDAAAQSLGVALADYLGSRSVPLRVSYILGIGTRDEVLAEAQRVVGQGVRVLKVKVGRDWEADLARIEKMQEVLGPAVALYADANECMDPADAAWKLDALRERGLLYCEEPLPVELVRERAALRRAGHLPLIADDSAFTARELARELALDTFDVLNIKTARTGYSESRQMLDAALAAGKGIMVGSQAAGGLGSARAALFAALPGIEHPSELSFFLKLEADIVERSLPIRDGFVQPADAAAVRVEMARVRELAIKL